MNNFTKEELQYMLEMVDSIKIVNRSINDDQLQEKLQSMIDNYCEHENTETIGTGQLLFHNRDSESALIPKICKQISLCENDDETKCFRIDWKILYGKKFGQ